MAEQPEFKPRSTSQPGVAGFLEENCDIIYSSIFSSKSIGRISDLICAKLESKTKEQEAQVRLALLLTLFEGTFAGKLIEAPVSLECGTDGHNLAIGTTFITEPDLLLASPLFQGDTSYRPKSPTELCLSVLRQICQHVYIKVYSKQNQVELVGVLSLDGAPFENTHQPIHVVRIDETLTQQIPINSYTELGDLDYAALLEDTQGIPGDQKKVKTGNLLAKSLGEKKSSEAITKVKGVTDKNDSEKIIVSSDEETVTEEEVVLSDEEKPSPSALKKQKKKNKELKEKLFKYKKNGQLTDDVAMLIEGGDDDSLSDEDQFVSLKDKNEKLANSLKFIQTEENNKLIKSAKQFKLDEEQKDIADLIQSKNESNSSSDSKNNDLEKQNEILKKKIAEYQAREARSMIDDIKNNSDKPKTKNEEDEIEYYKEKISKIKSKASKTFSMDPDLMKIVDGAGDPDASENSDKKIQVYKTQLATLQEKITELQKEKENEVFKINKSESKKSGDKKGGLKKLTGAFKKLFFKDVDIENDTDEEEISEEKTKKNKSIKKSEEEAEPEVEVDEKSALKKLKKSLKSFGLPSFSNPEPKEEKSRPKSKKETAIVSKEPDLEKAATATMPSSKTPEITTKNDATSTSTTPAVAASTTGTSTATSKKSFEAENEQVSAEDQISPDDFMKEIEQGGLSKLEKTLADNSSSATDDKNKSNQERYSNMMSEVAAEKTRLLELAKKLHQSIRQKELFFQNKEQTYQSQISKINEELKQRESAVNHFKNQYTQSQSLIEQMKKEKESNADDLQYKHKYLQQQKMLNSLKDEALANQKKFDEVKNQLAAAKAGQKVKTNTQEIQDLNQKIERANKQADEYKKQYQNVMEKMKEKKPSPSDPNANPEEMRRRYESALKMASISKKDAEVMKTKLDEMKRDEVKNRLELAKAQEEIKRLQAALTKATPSGGRKPPKAA